MALTQVKTTGLADDAVTEAKVANDAISPAEMKAGTDGHIITYDASGNPTTVGPGTDGQVLTSTGAGSPPAFEDVPAGGATINNATANEVVTVASTTTQLDAEANLTFDGNNLKIGAGASTHADADDLLISKDAAISGISIQNADDGYGCLNFGDASDNDIGRIAYAHNGNSMRFHVNGAEKMRIKDGGNVTIEDGNLVVASGHGIDFAATGDGSGTDTSEVLDDYEEGTWTPSLTGSGSNPSLSYTNRGQGGGYIKVGQMCTAWWYSEVDTVSTDGSGTLHMSGLPYASADYQIGGESAGTAGWMRVGTSATGEHKEPYWRNQSESSHLMLQYRNDSDGSQSNPSAAASVPNDFFSIGYILYRTT